MFAKLSVLILAVVLVAVALLALRQERVQLGHQIARTHEQINQTRQALWSAQSEVARHTQPDAIRQAALQANLKLEPLTLAVVRPESKPHLDNPVRVADRSRTRRNRGE